MFSADGNAVVDSSTLQPQPLDLYRSLFALSPQPFALHKVTTNAAGKPLDCVCVDANAAFQTVLGIPREKLIGSRIHEISAQLPSRSLFPVIEDVLFDHEPDHLTVLSPSNHRYYDVAVTLVAPGVVATVLSELIGIRGVEPTPRSGSAEDSAARKPSNDATPPAKQPRDNADRVTPAQPGSDRASASQPQPRSEAVAPETPATGRPNGASSGPVQAWYPAVEKLLTGTGAPIEPGRSSGTGPDPRISQPRNGPSARDQAPAKQTPGSPSRSTLGGSHSYLASERTRSGPSEDALATDAGLDFDESMGEIHRAMMAASVESYVPEAPKSDRVGVSGTASQATGQALTRSDPVAPISVSRHSIAPQAIAPQEPDPADTLPFDRDLWALVLRGSGEGIWDWDLRTSHVTFSSRWKRMLGYSDAEVRDQFGQYARLVHPDDLPAALQTIQNYLTRQTDSYESEHRLRCRDGQYRWMRSRGSALWDENGAASRMVVFQADIQDRRQVDLHLARTQLLSASLRNVRQAAARAQGRDELLQVACTSLVERGLVQRAWIGEYDENTGVVTPVARDGVDKVDLGTVRVPKAGDPFRSGPTAVAIASKEPHVANDVSQLEVRFPWAQQAARIGYGSAAAFPIVVGERAFGALTVYADESGFFGPDEVTLIEEISSVLGFALYGMEQKELRKQAETELQRVSYHDPLTGLYNRPYFEEELRRLQGSRLYPITIVSTDVDGLKVVNDVMGNRAGDQLLTGYANVLKSSFRTSDVVARVGGDEFAIILPTTDAQSAQDLVARLLERMNAHNGEGRTLPLSHSLGVATADEPFDSLEILCRQADNAMFIDRNRRAPQRGRNLVRALMTALRKKDFGAEGHVSRVKVISTTLGEAVGLTSKDMADLELLSEIHDLGKIGIPDRVLFKAGPLDHDEREQIKQHSALGFRIAKISPELEHIADLILYHQEWWNGAGYPTGIGGEEIPVACRVLAIADAYDAMTSARPHRPALSHDEAVEELRHGAGRQFDPAMVEKFLQITEGS